MIDALSKKYDLDTADVRTLCMYSITFFSQPDDESRKIYDDVSARTLSD